MRYTFTLIVGLISGAIIIPELGFKIWVGLCLLIGAWELLMER